MRKSNSKRFATKRCKKQRTRRRSTYRRNTSSQKHQRTRKAGMFRAASRQARHLSKELGKELIKDIADRSLKKALKGDKGDTLSKLSSGKLKRAQSRLTGAYMSPINLSSRFESVKLSPMTPTYEGTPRSIRFDD